MYRIDDTNGLAVQRVGYRFNKTYVLEDIKYYTQYSHKAYNA